MNQRDYLAKIGMEFKVARIRKGMSRTQIGKITGLSRESIGMLENGKKDSHILTYKLIADAIGVELKDLL